MGKNGEEFYGEFGSDSVKNSPFFPIGSPQLNPSTGRYKISQLFLTINSDFKSTYLFVE